MKKIKAIKLLFKYPVKIILKGIIAANDDFHKKQIKTKYRIEQLPTIDLLDLFPNFQESLSTYSFLEGTSLITDIMLLKKLAKKYENCAYLEIGSWRGESITNVAESSGNCTCLTLSKNEMKIMGFSEKFILVHGIFSKDAKNIDTIAHDSQTFDFSRMEKKFDLIFVDGAHSYEAVLNDTKNVFKLRKDSSSIVVWHDYGYSTETVRYPIMAAILDGIPINKHRNLYHVSNTMCAVYIEHQKLETYLTNFPIYPNKKFSVTIKAEKL